MLEFSDYLFITLGPNCYMRGLLRKIVKNNPNDPWVWQHFFDINTYKMFLDVERIKLVADSLDVINNSNTLKPEFWSETYKIYAPHINDKVHFTSVEDSRQLYYEVTVQRLERLKTLIKDKKIIFLTSSNRSRRINGDLKNGFDYYNYEKIINSFLKEFCIYLNVERERCHFWLVDKKEKLNQCFKNLILFKSDENLNMSDISNIENGKLIETLYTPESFSFETGEGLENAKQYWFNWFENLTRKDIKYVSNNNNFMTLFTTFFLIPDNTERQEELLTCLNIHIQNKFIKNIFLLLDGKDEELIQAYIKENVPDTNKINFVNVKRIPTYGDWIQYSKWYAHELADISVFVNADIYLDETIVRIKEYTAEKESIVCLSRHNVVEGGDPVPHPNPQWSQDLWAISKENILSITNTFFVDELNITPTGVYRCDNKLAYIFAMRGWVIYNPFPSIKCYHLQKDVSRSYGRLDTNIVGGLCFPSPTNDSSTPSVLDISVMPVKVGNITKCAINKYLERNLFPEQHKISLTVNTIPLNNTIEITRDFKPMYVWPNKAFPFREYFTSDKLKIFIIENIVHNYEWLNAYKDKITDKHFFFVYLGCYHNEQFAKHYSDMFSALKLKKDNFFFMCNSSNEMQYLTKAGFKGDVINHNAWLDENLYSIKDCTKIYDAILIARQAKWKRHYLASKVPNLALIAGGAKHGHTEQIILPPHKFNNEKQLTLEEVTEKINQSKVGLCLSKEEGACFSSSEYLLCGIPVVSTKSEGGRDFWYDDYNSIICEDNEESVAEAVEKLIQSHRDSEIIRSNHIALAKQQRAKFIKVLQQVFYKYDIDVNAFVYFKNNYINKMRTSNIPDFNKIFT